MQKICLGKLHKDFPGEKSLADYVKKLYQHKSKKTLVYKNAIIRIKMQNNFFLIFRKKK